MMKEEIGRYIHMNVWIVISLIMFAFLQFIGQPITYSTIYIYLIVTFAINAGFAYNGYRKNKK